MPRSTRYRGRRGFAKFISGLGLTILILAVLGGTAYLFLRQYVDVTDKGVFIEFPFWEGAMMTAPTASPSPSPTPTIQVIIEAPPTVSATPEAPTPTPEASLKAVFLPQASFSNTDTVAKVATLCETGRVDTVVLEVKSLEGVIATASPELATTMQTLRGKAKLVAYLSVLQDNTVTRQKSDFGIKHTSGVNWLDINSMRWLNPYKPDVHSWLVQQVTECNALSFDALLLDTLWFPADGRQNTIAWGSTATSTRAAALQTLSGELVAAATVPCWAVLQPDVCLGNQPQKDSAAQDIPFYQDTFEQLFVRLPMENPAEVYDSMVAAGLDDLYPIVQLPSQGSVASGSSVVDVAQIALGTFENYIAVSAMGEYDPQTFATQ